MAADIKNSNSNKIKFFSKMAWYVRLALGMKHNLGQAVHCKKSVDFTVKYLATCCQYISRCFYGRLLVEHF